MIIIGNDWDQRLQQEWKKEYYQELRKKLFHEYQNESVYPPMDEVYNALRAVSYQQVKVVILGQDPYHGPNQAHGFSFSVKKGVKIPPSLLNIYKELRSDLGYDIPSHGCLEKWSNQGVLLLNSSLTVRRGKPNSHHDIGWVTLTDYIIETLGQRETPIVFILWGNYAIAKKNLIKNEHHLVLTSPHPSPFSANRGFFHSKPFSKTNQFLMDNHMDPIDWRIDEDCSC